jgi:large conductance mechanosensitive channel
MPDPEVTLQRAGARTVGVLREFRQFILRGNPVDLAVAVVIGTAFTAVVNALVASLITPLIAAIGGQPDFGDLAFDINGSTFRYGVFINALLTFLIVAAVVFFFVVKPVNHLMERYKTEPDVDRPTRDCPECLSQIPVEARRCSFCTSEVGTGATAPFSGQPAGDVA